MNKGYNGRKAQGLSLNMIVVGAIGLVVLVVIITIFTSGMIGIQKDLNDKACCQTTTPGVCGKNISGTVRVSSCNNGENPVIGDFPDVSAAGGQICCIT